MIAVLLALAIPRSSDYIARDSYGVPHIKAPSWAAAFQAAGYAIAEDRLWQLENSRRIARGRMAEVFGQPMAASDREVLATFYTEDELKTQVDKLSPQMKEAWEFYAAGINEYIAEAKKAGKLPKGYSENGFEPAPWTPLDSAAIAIRMGHMFGRGGAGEIRNLALISYLKGQPVKDKTLDVIDDFAWQNDPASIPTVVPAEDPLARAHPTFTAPKRAETQTQLDEMPPTNLLELLPGLRLASLEESTRVAESVNAPFKTGSYAVVVGKSRSRTGWPLLLSAPQMGFTTPSIVHEMSIEAPGISTVGMDVPGIPGILIGHTNDLAWGLTSGVADTDDIFVTPMADQDEYKVGNEKLKIKRVVQTLPIKGQDPTTVTQLRTVFGPVVVTSTAGKAYFSRRSAFAGRELESFDAMQRLWQAKSAADVQNAVEPITLNFNLFFATKLGDIGYFYCGLIPMRAPGVDPRFPTPADPKFGWKGIVPKSQMPRLINPKSGLIANWNNKPAAWWPNFDTPAWGRIFRNEVLLDSIGEGLLGTEDLEMAAWRIARRDESTRYFLPLFKKVLPALDLKGSEADARRYLLAYEGLNLEGSQGATIFRATMDALREEVFMGSTGNFLSPDLFRLAAQPTVMLNALEKRTRYDYLAGRSREQVIDAAFKKAVQRLVAQRGPDPATWGLNVGGIAIPEQAPIPYSNRGTYIQIVELRSEPRGRNVLPPGVSEDGPHARDQAPLARSWQYKPMRWFDPN
jgi:penicillin amidase